ncbi:MAG: PAS domain-containing protein [Chloracidobacterium sp.]|nr:PAS domain-containing protein [Chloracidobacterium sp.]
MDASKVSPVTIHDNLSERAALLEQALSGQGEMLAGARRAHALLASTFNAISDAIIVTDVAGRVTQANDAVLRLFNRAPDDVIGDTCHSMLDESQGCPHTQMSEDDVVIEVGTLNRARDRALNLRVSLVTDPESGSTGFIHIIRDVTRERVIERHLIQAERMSLAGQMVSAVAHEVATPLSVVANIAEMLQLDAVPNSRLAADLGKIVTQARRVTEMMRSLLNFVRQAPSQYSPVDLGQLTRETLDLMSYELRKARVDWQFIADPVAPPVWGDRGQLQQVLLNLLANAMQAMADGGRIVIRIRASEIQLGGPNAVALVVEDAGPGIAPDALGKIFDFFFTTRVGSGGAGLGLAIVKQIVEGHHGNITAENMSGGGARFTVTLPVAFPQRRNTHTEAPIVAPARE